jgi:hypothetical protein
MSYQAEIQQLLNTRLSSLSGLPKWKRENSNLAVNEKELFIETFLLPAEPDYPNIGLEGFKVESGIFAINVKAVRGVGWGTHTNLIDSILNHFYRNLVLSSGDTLERIRLRVLKSYAISGFTDMEGRYTVPVHVKYNSYVLIQ